MNGYFPPAPVTGGNPTFNLFQRLQSNQNTRADPEKVKQIQAMMLGQGPAQNVGQGIGQLMGGVALNIAKRNAAFPTAPGGAAPSFGTGLMNFFTGGHNGGLF